MCLFSSIRVLMLQTQNWRQTEDLHRLSRVLNPVILIQLVLNIQTVLLRCLPLILVLLQTRKIPTPWALTRTSLKGRFLLPELPHLEWDVLKYSMLCIKLVTGLLFQWFKWRRGRSSFWGLWFWLCRRHGQHIWQKQVGPVNQIFLNKTPKGVFSTK